MPHRNIAIVLANGRHARILGRNHETGDLQDWIHIEDGPASDRFGPGGAGVDERRRQLRAHSFVEVIAVHLGVLRARHLFNGVLVVAPARMVSDLETAIARDMPVVGTAALDLLTRPAHEVAALLEGRLLAAEGALETASR